MNGAITFVRSNGTSYFSDSYREAREQFLEIAHHAGALIESLQEDSSGPNEEALFVDIARMGPVRPEKALVVISGTHGIEGFCGSACQCAFLETPEFSALAQSGISICLIHALNPYGFAWLRRVTKENVDLNRNFVPFTEPLPRNPEYVEIEATLNRRTLSAETLHTLSPEIRDHFASTSGIKAFKAAVGRGQYDFPNGLIYGGSEPTWNNRIIRSFISTLPPGIRSATVLDFHTGLGESGSLEIFTEENHDKFRVISQWFAKWKVTTLGDPIGLGYIVSGSLYQAFTAPNEPNPWHCVALEFGTQPLPQVLLALQADNWLHAYAGTQDPLRAEINSMMRDAFYPSSPQWRTKVLETGVDVISTAAKALMEAQ